MNGEERCRERGGGGGGGGWEGGEGGNTPKRREYSDCMIGRGMWVELQEINLEESEEMEHESTKRN